MQRRGVLGKPLDVGQEQVRGVAVERQRDAFYIKVTGVDMCSAGFMPSLGE